MRKSNGPRMDPRGTPQGTTPESEKSTVDFSLMISIRLVAMTLINHGIRVILVYEAGFSDPQCRKVFWKLSLPCWYRNPCPFEKRIWSVR